MGYDTRAVVTQGYWLDPTSALNSRVPTLGYSDAPASPISIGGITDSIGTDWLDSEGNVIFDSQGISDPDNPFGINSIISWGYQNNIASQLNARVVSLGYLGTFGMPLVWLVVADAKSWLALNSYFRMR